MTKTLFITGASSGIGAATARAAAKAGWNVGLFARSEDKLKDLAREIGDQALVLTGDATQYDDQEQAMSRLAQKFGQIDAVFANAGRGTSPGGTEKGDPDDWKSMIDLNVMGALYTAHAAMPYLRKTTGQYVVTGSAAGRRHIKGSIYGATKWAITGYGQNLREELRDDGVKVTLIEPGMVDTPFFDQRKPDAMQADDVAGAVLYAISQPENVLTGEIWIEPMKR